MTGGLGTGAVDSRMPEVEEGLLGLSPGQVSPIPRNIRAFVADQNTLWNHLATSGDLQGPAKAKERQPSQERPRHVHLELLSGAKHLGALFLCHLCCDSGWQQPTCPVKRALLGALLISPVS